MGGTNSVPISNLDTDIALTSVLKVWLSVSVSGAVAQTGAIAWGGAWPGAGLIVGSGLSQTQFNIPIGKVTTPADNVSGFRFFIGSTAYMFEQYVFSNLLCEVRCAGGAPALYAFPFAGGVA